MNKWVLLLGTLLLAPDAMGQVQTCNRSSEACLSWERPAQNTDGSAIPAATIVTYTIYKSRTADALQPHGTTTSTQLKITDLQSGVWYFAVTATTGGGTSAMSSVVSKNLLPRLGKPITLGQPVVLPSDASKKE